MFYGIEGAFDDLFEYYQTAGFDSAEKESKTSVVHTVNLRKLDKERQQLEEMKRNAVDVEFEEVY